MLNILINDGVFNLGDHVQAQTNVVGVVTIESDLSQSSTSKDLTGVTAIDIGPISGAGFFSVRFLSDMDRQQIAILSVPEDNGKLDLSSIGDIVAQAVKPELLARFFAALTIDRVKMSAANVIDEWLATNATAIGSVVLVCLIAGLAPESGVAPMACGKAIGGGAADLAATIMLDVDKSMEVDGTISHDERVILDLVFAAANIRLAKELSEEGFDRILAAVSVAGDQVFANARAKVAFHITVDFARKVNILIDLRP